MHGWLILSAAFLAGMALGLFYFEALWLTVKRLSSHPRPHLLLFESLSVRLAVVLTGFYFVMAGSWERLAACLAGFFIMRALTSRRVKRAAEGAAV
ncbi:MAG: ATP synthase subunit I [Syntrophaceae bacterium]